MDFSGRYSHKFTYIKLCSKKHKRFRYIISGFIVVILMGLAVAVYEAILVNQD